MTQLLLIVTKPDHCHFNFFHILKQNKYSIRASYQGLKHIKKKGQEKRTSKIFQIYAVMKDTQSIDLKKITKLLGLLLLEYVSNTCDIGL